ncbi:hypothetical protein K1719_010979 [Acacia pycnantha]|nr:hypothetical protein K1719_010979 [Acacia pycnantha]
MPVFIPIHIPARPENDKKRVMSENQVREILEISDENKDDNLSWSELKKAVSKMGAWWPLFRAWCCLRNADANNDGYISPSERDDLVRYIMTWYHAER